MKLAITFLCLAGVAFSAPIGHTELSDMFRQFKTDFNKVYEHATEEAMRFGIFTKTVDMIQDFNEHAAASQGFTMGINQFSDWTREEYSSFLTYNASAKKASNVVVLDEANLTDSVDWVAKGAVTPVKNQKTCGSCWAFSTTGSIEGAVQINGGGLISLSEQELVDCAGTYGNQGCNGGLMDDAFKFVQAKGLEKESDYSYTAADGTCNTQKEDEHDGIAPGKITSFNDVTADSCSQLKAAVTKQPVSVAIQANQPAFQNYKQGILSSGCGTQLDHGVLVVGYGSDNGKDYWKVKNSWGTTWGDEGYLKIAMTGCDSGRRLLGGGGGGSKKGVCGILSTPSYPVV